jgi:hypothetical protein
VINGRQTIAIMKFLSVIALALDAMFPDGEE